MAEEKFTFSELQQFLNCPRQYYYNYKLLYSPVFEGVPRPAGTAIHKGVEAIFAGKNPSEAAAEAVLAFWEEVKVPESELSDKDRNAVRSGAMQVRECVVRYPWGEGIELLHQEMVLEGEIGGRHFTGRVDRLVRVNGKVWVWETKTTGLSMEAMVKVMRLRKQLPGYVELVRQNASSLGIEKDEIAGIQLDLIGKPRVYWRKDGTATVKDPLYNLEPININWGALEAFSAWFQRVTEDIVKERPLNEEPWPQNTDSCFRFMRVCSYFEACRTARIEGVLDGPGFERRETKHRELERR